MDYFEHRARNPNWCRDKKKLTVRDIRVFSNNSKIFIFQAPTERVAVIKSSNNLLDLLGNDVDFD